MMNALKRFAWPGFFERLTSAGMVEVPLVFLIFFFSFFPYIRPFSSASEIQPYALVLSGMLFLFRFHQNGRYPVALWLMSLPFLAGLVIFFMTPHDTPWANTGMNGLRSVGSYASLFFIPCAFYFILGKYRKSFEIWLVAAILVWFFVGLAQTLISPKLFTTLVGAKLGGHSGRGITSLSTEPSNYGLVVLFFLLFLILKNEKRWWLYGLLLVQLFAFSKSSLAIVFFSVFLVLGTLLLSRSKKSFWGFAASVLLVWLVLDQKLFFKPNSRIFTMYERALNDLPTVIRIDTSINERLSHVIFSLDGFLQNFPWSGGYGSFSDYFLDIRARYGDLISTMNIQNRIMSGLGSSLYELGIAGLMIPFIIGWIVFMVYDAPFRKRLFFFLVLIFLSISSMPLALPLFSIMIAMMVRGENSPPESDEVSQS